MYIIIIKVTKAIIIVIGRLPFLWKLVEGEWCLEDKSRYELKIDIAYGIISNKAIDRNNVPENVKAIDIIFPSLKHDKLDINFPNMTTSAKKTIIRTNLIISILSIIF